MRVYLDDERPTPDGWVRVYWPSEAIALLETGNVRELSLDHDLVGRTDGLNYLFVFSLHSGLRALLGWKVVLREQTVIKD